MSNGMKHFCGAVFCGRDSSGSPQADGVREAYADGATRERPGALAEHTS